MCVWKEEGKENEASKSRKQSKKKKTKGGREFMHISTLP
jgi:hypothetical protein